jgi:inorganic pyrophosphatase
MNNKPSRLFEILVELPRWGFIRRNSDHKIEFISPLPCPFNYGAIPEFLGMDGDFLDAVVLGPRHPRGTVLTMRAYGVIGLTDRGLYDDKLICSTKPLSASERFLILNFFRCYAVLKKFINFTRGRRGPTCCEGWRDIDGALSRARTREEPWRALHAAY